MAEEQTKAGMVNIFNNTTRMLSVGLRRRRSNDRGPGPSVVSVRFLPGNNRIKAETWDECKAVPTVLAWMSNLYHIDRTGRPQKTKWLIEGHHDEEFTDDSKVLADRMTAAREAQLIPGMR